MTVRNTENWGIHWFRRDLRVEDNPGLQKNIERTGGRTLGLFCFDSKFLSRDDFSHRRFAFFIETMKQLRNDLEARGGELLVVDLQPDEAFAQIALQGSQIGKPALVTFNRDYEPFARDRDERVTAALQKMEIEVVSERDHLIFEPHEITKPSKDKSPYQKYSPFARQWVARLHEKEGRERVEWAKSRPPVKKHVSFSWQQVLGKSAKLKDALEHFERENAKRFHGELPPAGHAAARAQVKKFAKILKDYERDRAIPAVRGSAELSKYLKNGSLTLAHVIHDLDLIDVEADGTNGPGKFLKELVWREFYYYTLYHYPKVEGGAFVDKYRAIKWENDEKQFELWKQGKTGVPIVDAGMRELAQTGWINNRVRIIVATFLIKDLLIDWRWGEKHFMHQLIDGDLAANNGNWQWVGSTGNDAQPFFRVMNPWTQGKNFDADAEYIKRWVPELKSAPVRVIHDEESDRSAYKYPKPLVSHSVQRPKAIALYKNPGTK